MINKPTVPELLTKAENRYSLVIATAKRARELADGSKRQTDFEDASMITEAIDEIDKGKINIYNNEEWQEIVKDHDEIIKNEQEKQKLIEKNINDVGKITMLF